MIAMMIYGYACACCGNEWDVEQKMTDPPIIECPKCRVACAKRIVTGGTGFILKGDGWSRDLYASKMQVGEKSDGDSH